MKNFKSKEEDRKEEIKRSFRLKRIDETRPRGRRFHVVSRQKLFRTYQIGELRVN